MLSQASSGHERRHSSPQWTQCVCVCVCVAGAAGMKRAPECNSEARRPVISVNKMKRVLSKETNTDMSSRTRMFKAFLILFILLMIPILCGCIWILGSIHIHFKRDEHMKSVVLPCAGRSIVAAAELPNKNYSNSKTTVNRCIKTYFISQLNKLSSTKWSHKYSEFIEKVSLKDRIWWFPGEATRPVQNTPVNSQLFKNTAVYQSWLLRH